MVWQLLGMNKQSRLHLRTVVQSGHLSGPALVQTSSRPHNLSRISSSPLQTEANTGTKYTPVAAVYHVPAAAAAAA